MSDNRDNAWTDAVICNNLTAMKCLCDKGYDQDRPTVFNLSKGAIRICRLLAVFHASTSYDNLELLLTLCETGADIICASDPRGAAPIHYTAEYGSLKILKRLVRWGVDLFITYQEEHKSVAHEAAAAGHSMILRVLFETDLSLLHSKMKTKYTPAHISVLHRKLFAVKVCVGFGADINRVIAPFTEGISGMTMLDLAVGTGSYKIVKRLRKNGAKVSIQLVNCARMGVKFPWKDLKNEDKKEASLEFFLKELPFKVPAAHYA